MSSYHQVKSELIDMKKLKEDIKDMTLQEIEYHARNNGWSASELWVTKSIEEMKLQIKELHAYVEQLKVDNATNKTKLTVYATIAGFAAGGVLSVVMALIRTM